MKTEVSLTITPLDLITSEDELWSGGKAYNCARLRQAGFLVPDGIVVLATATDVEVAGGFRAPLVQIDCSMAIVQIGFLSSKETFERLSLRLNEDGSIAIDPYFETSRRGIFAVGDVHGEHQTDCGCVGRRNSSRHSRLQGNHEPILA